MYYVLQFEVQVLWTNGQHINLDTFQEPVTLTSAAAATALVHIVLLSATDSNTKQARTGL